MKQQLPLRDNRGIKTPPGTRLRSVIEVALSKSYREQHLEPLYRDATRGWFQAHLHGSSWRLAMIAVRFYAGLAIVLLHLPFAIALKLWRG